MKTEDYLKLSPFQMAVIILLERAVHVLESIAKAGEE